MISLKKALAVALIAVFAACKASEEYYENGNLKSRSFEFNPALMFEVKPDGVTLRTSKVTFEDGSQKDAEIIDTDGDGEGDQMWVPDDTAAGGGVGGPFTYS